MTADPRRPAGPLLALVVLLLATLARGDVGLHGLFARGQGDKYWIVTVAVELPKSEATQPATLPADAAVVTSVRTLADPIAGTWTPVADLAGPAVAAAPLGDGLAILDDAGGWRVLWPGRQVEGTRPPPGLRLLNFAADGPALWAVARAGDDAVRLLRWTEADGWHAAADAPPGCTADAAVGVYSGVPYLAWRGVGGVHVARFDAGKWSEPVPPLPAGRPKEVSDFASGSPTPLFWSVTADGVDLWDLRDCRATPTRHVLVEHAWDAAVVGPSLRVVAVKDKRLWQTAVDDAGRGPQHAAVVLAEPTPPGVRGNEWGQVLVLTLLTALTFTTLRTRPATPDALTPAVAPGLTIAPPARRLLAGLIDAAPVLATGYWVFSHFEGTADDLTHSPTRIFLPLFVAGAVYLFHVTLSEWRTGRSAGKWLLGLRVVSLDGTPADGEKVFVRNLLRALDGFGLPLLFVLVSPLGQRVGDLAAKTVVVVDPE